MREWESSLRSGLESTGQPWGVDRKVGGKLEEWTEMLPEAIEVNQKANTSLKRRLESGMGSFHNWQAKYILMHFANVSFCVHATNSVFSQYLTITKWGFEILYAPIIYKREEYPDVTFISWSKKVPTQLQARGRFTLRNVEQQYKHHSFTSVCVWM